jgi:hypothetical protein
VKLRGMGSLSPSSSVWRNITKGSRLIPRNSRQGHPKCDRLLAGGHLATVFTELHEAEVNHTYTFNGAGRGTIVEQGQVGQPDVQSVRRMLQDLDARIQTFDPNGDLFRSGSAGNIYQDDRYQNTLIATRQIFTTIGTAAIVSTAIDQGAFAKITQLHGSAVTGSDFEFVANSGIHATPVPVLIEGQPIREGRDDQGQLQFGNAHSLTLLVDSLALMDLFQTIDPQRTQAELEAMFKASSDAKAQLFVSSPDTPNAAEGDTLEQALDALRRVFLGPTLTPATLPVDSRGGGFGNLANRNAFYTGLDAVAQQLSNQTSQIDSLVGQSAEGAFAAARQNDATGLAYRYALKELNPFVVRGAEYSPHNTNGELDLYNAATGPSTWTLVALSDRADLLAELVKFNEANGPVVTASLTLYEDKSTFFNNGRNATATEAVMFGDTEFNDVGGRSGNDHLYGGAGNDILQGARGQDYLEGNAGDDLLRGKIVRPATLVSG